VPQPPCITTRTSLDIAPSSSIEATTNKRKLREGEEQFKRGSERKGERESTYFSKSD